MCGGRERGTKCHTQTTHEHTREQTHPVKGESGGARAAVAGLSLNDSVPALVPVSILRSFVRLHPRFRSRSVLVPFTVRVPVPTFDPVPVYVPAPAPGRSLPSRGPGTPSVRCACTDTGPCKWSCRVPPSTTPCLQRRSCVLLYYHCDEVGILIEDILYNAHFIPIVGVGKRGAY